MTGIGELAYMVLLGWMRALVDWFWVMVSGGSSSGWQWFLSNWKIWLVILLGGGLVVDWLMWVIRWRPYRLLFSRFSHTKKDNTHAYEESWDTGVGFYAPETMLDQEPSEWSDLTLSTLSEVDPDWANNMMLDTDGTPLAATQAKTYFYNQDYEEPAEAYIATENAAGYFEDEQENESPIAQWQAMPYADGETSYDDQATPYDDDEAPYDATSSIAHAQQHATYDQNVDYYEDDDIAPVQDDWVDLPTPDNDKIAPASVVPSQYGRPSRWPGMFPHVENMQAPVIPIQENEPQPSNYYADEVFQDDLQNDPLFSNDYQAYQRPERQGRQLRKLRKSDQEASRRRRKSPIAEEIENDVPMLSQDRPGRLVKPVSAVPNDSKQKAATDLRTVTGKPVKRQGIIRFAATDDEPIPGLPPLPLDDPFLPKAMPHNPDFSDDDDSWN